MDCLALKILDSFINLVKLKSEDRRKSMKKDRIPEQVLPGNYYDGEVLYGSEMNKIVNVLRTGVNANKNDIDSIILDVEKYASITNLGIIDFSELDDIAQVGIYKFSVRRPD